MEKYWGDALIRAYEGATHAARIVAKSALMTSLYVVKKVSTSAREAVPIIGEVINTAGGLTVALGVSAYSGAASILSSKNPGNHLLVQQCPGKVVDVFTNTYRSSLINTTFAGAGDKKLTAAMVALANKNPPIDLEYQLKIIALSRGRKLEEIKVEYIKFTNYRLEIDDKIVNKSLGKIEILSQANKEFMGSNWQLRFGKVVGDYLDIDPVFASLLHPTGGLVGPGNTALFPNNVFVPQAVAYHGAYHDAVGFIYQYFGRGSGYNYMESPFGLDTNNPLAGQATGVGRWAVNLMKSRN